MTKDELKAIGVNPEYLTYPSGKYNIIVQCFGNDLRIYKQKTIKNDYRNGYKPTRRTEATKSESTATAARALWRRRVCTGGTSRTRHREC